MQDQLKMRWEPSSKGSHYQMITQEPKIKFDHPCKQEGQSGDPFHMPVFARKPRVGKRAGGQELRFKTHTLKPGSEGAKMFQYAGGKTKAWTQIRAFSLFEKGQSKRVTARGAAGTILTELNFSEPASPLPKPEGGMT